MKMRKLLATGVAASVAVTSLATVASAAEQTFDMAWSKAKYGGQSITLGGDVNESIGESVKQATMQVVVFDLEHGWNEANKSWDSFENWSPMTLKVSGSKTDGDNTTAVNKEYKVVYGNAVAYKLPGGTPVYYYEIFGDEVKEKAFITVLDDEEYVYKDGEFAPAYFTSIDKMTLSFSVYGETTLESTYNAQNGQEFVYDIGNSVVYDWDGVALKNDTKPETYTESKNNVINKGLIDTAIDSDLGAAALVAYATAQGGYSASINAFIDPIIKKNFTLESQYPFMPVTDAPYDGKGDKILMRHEIEILSVADAWYADNLGGYKPVY